MPVILICDLRFVETEVLPVLGNQAMRQESHNGLHTPVTWRPYYHTNLLKRGAKRVLYALGILSSIQLKRFEGAFLSTRGWYESFQRGVAVDREGLPLPWFPYSAIDFLSERARPEMTVFEYGCGSGTFWWSARVKRVVSVEHHREWYDQLVPLVPKSCELIHVELDGSEQYAATPLRMNEQFDVVVIDGRDRVRCSYNAIKALKPNGVIVWDNMDREKYREGREFLIKNGFRTIPFSGIGPVSVLDNKNIVFYRPDNCLGI